MIGPRQRNVALLVAACFFMQNLDGTIVTTAASNIGKDLHVSAVQISLVITAYLITFAVLIPLGSWLVGRFGTRRVFLFSIVVFTLGSLACALSTDLLMLVLMRIVQGAGAALMTPTGRVVALTNVEKTDIMRMMSFIVWPALIAPVIAPVAGGLITDYTSWRWIFLINVPLGVVAFLVGLRLMARSEPGPRQSLDLVGLGYTAAGLGGLTYTAHLLSISTPGWISGAFAAGSLAFLAAAITHLCRMPRPLLSLRAFGIRTFRSASSGIALFMIVVQSIPFLIPLLAVQVFHWNLVKAGAVVMAVFIGNIGIKPATTPLYNAFGFRRLLMFSTFGVAISMFLIGMFRATTPIALMLLVIFFNGIVRSIGFTGYMTLSFSDVPESEMRDANVLAATVQQLAAGLAIATAAVALHIGGTVVAAIHPHPAAVSAYMAAFFFLSFCALICCAMAFRLPADAGDAVRRRVVSREPDDAELESTGTAAAVH